MIYKATGADRPKFNGSLALGNMDFIKKINPVQRIIKVPEKKSTLRV
jgi:hypothetical protein